MESKQVLHIITSNIQLETGFAYTRYNADQTHNEVYNYMGTDITTNSKFELDDSQAFFIGLNYKF